MVLTGEFGDGKALGGGMAEGFAAAKWGMEIGERVDLAEHVGRFSILGSLSLRIGPVEEYIGGQRGIHGAQFFDESVATLCRVQISKLRGTKGTSKS